MRTVVKEADGKRLVVESSNDSMKVVIMVEMGRDISTNEHILIFAITEMLGKYLASKR